MNCRFPLQCICQDGLGRLSHGHKHPWSVEPASGLLLHSHLAIARRLAVMSSTERHRGIQIHRGIIYGSHARLLTPEEKTTAPPEREWAPSYASGSECSLSDTHKWTIFISSATSPPPDPGSSDEIDMDLIPGGNDDLQYLFKRVTFKLHDTYHNPNRSE